MSRALDTTMRFPAFLAVFPLLAALTAPALARGTLDSILPEIRAQHPGRLSDAEPWTDGSGNTHYRIKWMTPDGRILYFDADARTGRYSSAGGDEGSQWRRRGEEGAQNDARGRRDHWNGDGGDHGWRGGDDNDGNGNWRGGGDWRGQGNGEWRGQGNGDWHGGRGGNRGGGNW